MAITPYHYIISIYQGPTDAIDNVTINNPIIIKLYDRGIKDNVLQSVKYEVNIRIFYVLINAQ